MLGLAVGEAHVGELQSARTERTKQQCTIQHTPRAARPSRRPAVEMLHMIFLLRFSCQSHVSIAVVRDISLDISFLSRFQQLPVP